MGVFFFVPVLPLGSYRVWRGDTSFRLLGINTQYQLVKVPPHWRQVLLTYAVTLFLGPLLSFLLGSVLLLAVWSWLAP